MDNDKKQGQGAPTSDTTSALFVSARKKQLEQQEEERRAKEKEEQRLAAEAEVRRLEREVEERRKRAEEEARIVELAAAENKRQADEEARRIAEEARAIKMAAASNPEAILGAQPQKKESKLATLTKAKPSAPGAEGGKKPLDKRILMFGGAGAAVILIVVILIVALSGGKGGTYSDWVEPLTISVNEYTKLSESKRRKMIERMDSIFVEEEGYSQLDFDAVDQDIMDGYYYIDPEYSGSAFIAACEVMDLDGTEYVWGYEYAFTEYFDVVTMSENDYTSIYFSGKLRAVSMAYDLLVEGGDVADSYQPVKLTAEVYDYIMDSKIDADESGGFFYAICKVLKLDGEKLYPDYCDFALYIDDIYGGYEEDWNDEYDTDYDDTDYDDTDYDDEEIPVDDNRVDYSYLDDAPEGYSTFFDDFSGLKLYYPNTTEAVTGVTGDASEIVAIRDGGYYLIAFNVTEMYQSINATDDLITESLMSAVIDNYFAKLFGSYEGIVPGTGWNQGADLNGVLGSIALGRFSCDIYAATQIVSAYAELTRVDKTSLIVLTMVFRQPDNDAQMQVFNGIMSSMQFNAAG